MPQAPLRCWFCECRGFFAYLAIFAIGLGFGSTAHAQEKPFVFRLQLNGATDVSVAGILVAQETGIFENDGLRVEILGGSTNREALSKVSAGEATIGLASAVSYLQASGELESLTAFAAGFLGNTTVFYSQAGSNVRTPADFIGKTIAYDEHSDGALLFEALLRKFSIPRSTIREVRLPAPVITGLLDKFDIRIGHLSTMLYLNDYHYEFMSPATFAVNVLGTVFFARRDDLKQHAPWFRRFVSGMIRGWDTAYSDYARSIPIVAKFDPVRDKPEILRMVMDQQRAFLRPLGARFSEYDREHWRRTQELMLAHRMLRKSVDFSRAVTFEFIQDAYRKPLLMNR